MGDADPPRPSNPLMETNDVKLPPAVLPTSGSGTRLPSAASLYPSQSHSTIAEVAEAFRVITHESSFDATALYALMRAHGQQPAEDEVHDLIKAVDQRGDGVVTFGDFAALMSQPVELDEIAQMRQAFAHLDKDNKGVIEGAQFVKLLSVYGEKSTPEECEEMLRFADPQETGEVDYNMFLATLAYRLQPRL